MSAPIDIVNGYRATVGSPPLRIDKALSTAASDFANYLAAAKELTPKDDKGRDVWDRVIGAGYVPAQLGEVIVVGYQHFDAAMVSIKNSSKDSAIIKDVNFSDIGIEEVHSNGSKYKHYYVLILGKPRA